MKNCQKRQKMTKIWGQKCQNFRLCHLKLSKSFNFAKKGKKWRKFGAKIVKIFDCVTLNCQKVSILATVSPKIVKKFQFCTLCHLKLSKSFTVGQKKSKINFGTSVSTNIVKKFRFCAQWAQKMKFGATVSTNIVKKFRKMNLAIFHGVCPWLVGIGSAPATTHLFLPVLKIARNWEQQPLQNIMEGEKKVVCDAAL